MIQRNIRSFRSNFEELKILLNRSQLAVVALQECRPIALTSCSKTLERIVNYRLFYVLEFRKLLSNVQCGFSKDHSTLDHLVRLDIFIKTFARKKQVLECPPPWDEHQVNLDISLTKQKKEDASEVAYHCIRRNFFRIKEQNLNHHTVYTDGSKREEKVAAAAYFPERPECSKATRHLSSVVVSEIVEIEIVVAKGEVNVKESKGEQDK
ncbi:ribonuclease hi [Plakobranchus ocellatus]|uniref:Ribonuclease hi n=1 Tax=Plakobranchus ocellatus TaxID=259542 RepID=A0AAV4AB82_9GAST|nr:ribonuclease hi [Plakobranchus ocellatus]